MKGKLFIISGQSGVGKNTILHELLKKHPEFHRAITCTTRDPRPNEIPNEDHYFIYKEKFDAMANKGEFLEYAKVHDEFYGTPKDQIQKALENGENVLMEIDVQGAKQIKKQMPEATLIFIKYEPGNLEELIRRRIKNDRKRGQIPEEEIQTRIASAQKEAGFEKYYDFSVINPEGNPDQAIEEAEKIITKELGTKNEIK